MFLLKEAMSLLAQTGTLPPKYKPHKLTGNYKDCWECHLRPDWLLVWKQNDKKLILLFTNTCRPVLKSCASWSCGIFFIAWRTFLHTLG